MSSTTPGASGAPAVPKPNATQTALAVKRGKPKSHNPHTATQPSSPASECQATEWANLSRTTASGSTLTKTDGGNYWNGGATSWQQITSGEGYVQITVDSITTAKMFGLNHDNVTDSWQDIDFAFELRDNGTLTVRENGSGERIAPVSYAVGDVLKVAVEGGSVKYYKNATLLFTSSAAPTYPLFLDASLLYQNSIFTDAYVCSLNINNPPVPIYGSGQLAEWANLSRVTVVGSNLTKTDGGNSWNGGATSWQSITSGEGYVQLTADSATTAKMFGLNHNNTTDSWQDIDFALELRDNGTLTVRENGSDVMDLPGNYSVGDVLRVGVEWDDTLNKDVVRWYRNNTRLYTDANPTLVYPLFLDTSVLYQNTYIINAYISADILNNPPVPGCTSGQPAPVEWTNLSRVVASGSTIHKTDGGNAWNAGATSAQAIGSGEGYVQITVDSTSTGKMFGLNHDNLTDSWQDIDFTMDLRDNGTLTVRENGSDVLDLPGNYALGDVLKVGVEYDPTLNHNVVRWYRNGTRLYTDVSPTLVYPPIQGRLHPLPGQSNHRGPCVCCWGTF